MKKWHIYFSGRVQGVGFRYTCQQAAERFAVNGWVRNLVDGRVELVVEGPCRQLVPMLQWVRENTHGEISDEEKSETDGAGDIEMVGFQIRH